ncbi:MAG: DUF2147 domain-containing protein [Chitinophagaceae bacterium]
MRQILLLLLSLLSYKSYAQANADLIIGKWLKMSKEDLIIEVYKAKGEYKGKISWAKNNDAGKLTGFQILDGLKYNSKKKVWSGGKVHNPKSGSTYSATVKIMADGRLEVLAYKGIKFIGRKKYFKKVK